MILAVGFNRLIPTKFFTPCFTTFFVLDFFFKSINLTLSIAKAVACKPGITPVMLFIFIATSNKLILYKVPEVLTVPKVQEDTSNNAENQALANQRKPILVVGEGAEINSDNIIKNDYINERFTPQIVTARWMENGVCLVFYINTNGDVRAIQSSSGGELWTSYPYI